MNEDTDMAAQVKAAIEDEAAHSLTMNVNQPQPDPVAADVTMRMQIIHTLHSIGEHDLKAEALASLRNAYPRYFRADS